MSDNSPLLLQLLEFSNWEDRIGYIPTTEKLSVITKAFSYTLYVFIEDKVPYHSIWLIPSQGTSNRCNASKLWIDLKKHRTIFGQPTL